MADETPYIDRNPGDIFTAEDWDQVQVMIKEDIADKVGDVEEALEEHAQQPVDAARFGGKTPAEWSEQFASKVHDHEGLAAYRRYFKRLRASQTVVLEHKLGRFPLVDVYELLPIAPTVPTGTTPINEKFYLYYHHEERDRDLLFTEDRGMVRWPWGTPLEQMLMEYGVEWEDDDSLGDVANDFLDAFFKPPTDHIDHRLSPWIDSHRERTVGELKQRDEWPDVRWVVRPEKLLVGHIHPFFMPEPAGGFHLINVRHLSYDTVAIITPTLPGAAAGQFIDLMILLRS